MVDSRKLEIELVLKGQEEINRKLDRVEKTGVESAAKVTSGFEKMQATFAKVALVAGAVYLGMQRINQVVGESVRLASDYTAGMKALEVQTSRVNESSEVLVRRLEKVTQGEISLVDLTQAANRSIALLGTDAIPKLDELAELALKASRVMGTTTAEAFDDLTLAIGRQSKMILDNLGIIMSVEEANENYAKTLGKTTKELTEAEKKQAFLNEALAQGFEKFGDIDTVTDDYKTSVSKLSAAYTNLLTESGKYITQSPDVVSATSGMTAEFRQMTRELSRARMQGEGLAGALRVIIGLPSLYDVADYMGATIPIPGQTGGTIGTGLAGLAKTGAAFVSGYPGRALGSLSRLAPQPGDLNWDLYDGLSVAGTTGGGGGSGGSTGRALVEAAINAFGFTKMGRRAPQYDAFTGITDYPDLPSAGVTLPNMYFGGFPKTSTRFGGGPFSGAFAAASGLHGNVPHEGGTWRSRFGPDFWQGTGAGVLAGGISGGWEGAGMAALSAGLGAINPALAALPAIFGSLFGQKKPHQQITEPIPVTVKNWSDMASAFLNITKGRIGGGASLNIDRLTGLKLASIQAGM